MKKCLILVLLFGIASILLTACSGTKVRITERIRWDSVYMVHGFGHKEKKLSRCFGKGISDTQLGTKVKTDPVMGGTGMRGNFVTFLTEKPAEKEVAS